MYLFTFLFHSRMLTWMHANLWILLNLSIRCNLVNDLASTSNSSKKWLDWPNQVMPLNWNSGVNVCVKFIVWVYVSLHFLFKASIWHWRTIHLSGKLEISKGQHTTCSQIKKNVYQRLCIGYIAFCDFLLKFSFWTQFEGSFEYSNATCPIRIELFDQFHQCPFILHSFLRVTYSKFKNRIRLIYYWNLVVNLGLE